MEAKAAERQILESMVQKITAAKKADPDANTDAWEREIDERVYRLYGLTKAEIAIVEGESSQ
jgi:NAD-specific glutamate dehydrogenase